ncbi:MAG: proton-conducting transporter membrane subunit [Desulfobulbaceae bacterium]|nr:proton-conducting transporter membrane subunit [Desulfobulbaceae bacterium]
MTIFLTSVLLLLLSGLLAPLSRKGSRFWDRFSLAAGIAGAILGLAASLACLVLGEPGVFRIPWPGIGGFFSLRIDALSSIFLVPAFFISGAGMLYGSGYWPHAEKPGSSAWIRFFYPLLAAGLALVLTSDNGVVFLISWEVMAIAGYFLVMTDGEDEENRKAGLVYLVSTHAGTLALFALFALLGEEACLAVLPAAGSLTGTAAGKGTALFLLTLFGFGIKAGIMPLHIWLPGAHAAAPSHVSALMSGVMIKTGIYGILRVIGFFQTIPAWWGWLLLGLGISSGILGVLFAIAQHDIKRLLAYHSIENIGIILIGIGAAMLGMTYNMMPVAVLGMAGALLHVVNHGLFKGLLFLSAGSMIHAVGSRQMSAYGGLLKMLPYTGVFFLGGAIAICGLPPLNGFVSEWFIYLALFHGGIDTPRHLQAVLLVVPALAMIGGLALLCFAKVFGLSFLGSPRSGLHGAQEASASMLWAMGLLLAACLWIGIAPATVQPFLSGAVSLWTGTPAAGVYTLSALAPAGYISLASALLLALLLCFLAAGRVRRHAAIRQAATWGCGYADKLPRAQYSTSSFAEMIMGLYNWALKTRYTGEQPAGLFPARAVFRSHTPDVILDLLLLPGSRKVAAAAERIRRIIHHGDIGGYLFYIALALSLLLSVAVFVE